MVFIGGNEKKMNKQEFDKVKEFCYSEYCEYLRGKYGMPKKNYCSESFVKSAGISRTSDGLFIHHTKENVAANLSALNGDARIYPYEFQKKENLVYCNYLEHLLLHIMIAEECQDLDETDGKQLGAGGVVNYIMPILNDIYSGRPAGLPWQINCFKAVIDDKDVYLECIKRFSEWWHNSALKLLHPDYDMLHDMCRSEGEMHQGNWDARNDLPLFSEITEIFNNAAKTCADPENVDPERKYGPIVHSILGPQEYWTCSDSNDGGYSCCYFDLLSLVEKFYKKGDGDISKILSYLDENDIAYDSGSIASALGGN